MRAAHAQVEKSLPRETLTLAVLTEWHSVACPRAGLRHAPWAFAKGGAERYSLDNDLLDQRLQVLGDQPPLARALRAYLDILFFHPYDDGNSRAARLAFHFFLGRDGPDLRIADPLFRLAIPAGQVRAYTLFQDLAHRCLR